MIIILGNSYFGPKLAKSLSSLNKEKIIYCNTNSSRFEQFRYMCYLPFSRAIYSISGSIKCGNALNLALIFNKKIYQHFIGSDVTEAIDDYRKNKHSEQLILASKFFSEVEWIKDEIENNLPIESEVLELPILIESKENSTPIRKHNMTGPLKILTYIGKDKEKFYGINEILEAASIRNDVIFTIVGSSCEKYELDSYSNVNCLGWVDDLKEIMFSHDIYLRFTLHDGLPFSVVEALSLGKFVIYNNNMPHCFVVKDINEILDAISNAELLVRNNYFNIDGREFVFGKYTEKKTINKIYARLE